jgi:predicted nucleotide-binding protein
MAKKPPKAAEPLSPPVLVIPRAEAHKQLADRVAKGEALRSRSIQTEQQLVATREEHQRWSSYNVELLTRAFSNRSEAETYSFWGVAFVGDNTFSSKLEDLHNDLDRELGRLRSLVERLDLIPEESQAVSGKGTAAPATLREPRAAFIVHGHDEAARESAARFLERLGVQPVILHEQANQGRTVIEKFEAHSDVPFAVVLLSPDDVGASRLAQNSLQPRARQNVIFELGFFIGKLGRSRVCALHAEGVELPSDFAGVVYVKMDAGGAWKLHLARELKVAGIDVDLNNAI